MGCLKDKIEKLAQVYKDRPNYTETVRAVVAGGEIVMRNPPTGGNAIVKTKAYVAWRDGMNVSVFKQHLVEYGDGSRSTLYEEVPLTGDMSMGTLSCEARACGACGALSL